MNTITIELCKEDRQRIDELISFAGLLVGTLKDMQAPVIAESLVAPLQTEEVTVGIPVEGATPVEPVTVEDATNPVTEEAPEVKPVPLAEFQKAVTLAVSKGAEAKKQVKAIINKYADSVSAVPEDKRAEVMAELEKI